VSALCRLLNYVGKHGASTANSLGVMALMYSGFGVILSYARGTDDEYNTLASATATGLLYKASGECEQGHCYPYVADGSDSVII